MTTATICAPFYSGQVTGCYDFTVTGKLSSIKEFWSQLKSISPKYGYYPKASNLAHGVLKLLNPYTIGLYPPLELTPPPNTPTLAWSIHPPGDARHQIRIARLLQMHIYYICNYYSVNKLTTFSLHQKTLKNKSINKIKHICWFNYKIVIGSQRKTSKC